MRDLACQFLRVKGYTVLEASGGQEALDMARQHAGTIHLLLSDMVMPKMNGGELAARMKEIRPDIRVAFMSGYSEFSRGDLAQGFPEAPVLQKPFSPISLVEIVREALAQEPAEQTAGAERVPRDLDARNNACRPCAAGDDPKRVRRQPCEANAAENRLLKIFVAASLLCFSSPFVQAQEGRRAAPSSPPPPESETAAEVRVLSEMIHDLQAQVQALNSQLGDLRAEQQQTSEEARALRHELDLAKAQMFPSSMESSAQYSTPGSVPINAPPGPASALAAPQGTTDAERISKLEENQEVIDAKVNDQYQTKVESGSKYRCAAFRHRPAESV